MPQTQDTQLALILTRLELLEQDAIDKALGIQAKAEEEGKPEPLAAVIVREGFLPYGVVERLIAYQADTPLSCKACKTETGAKSLDPKNAFVCPSCEKTLSLPEEDTALNAFETMIQEPAGKAKVDEIIGRVLGGCKLERKIGEGGMGAVYQATQEYLGRQVAVKILPEYYVHQAGFVDRFLRESRSAALVIHPNVVQVMDAGQEGSLHYIIMEFVPGKSLQDILDKDGKIPLDKALEYTRQTAMGLAAASEHNIVHRDVKPDNIRINPRGVAKVADFGLAKDVQTSTQVTMTGAVLGTPLYMSPEQARGEPTDFRSDIYSLGATLYHLIAGQPPFTGKSAMAILEKQTLQELPPIRENAPDCTPEAEDLIGRMMAKNPDERFESYDELVKTIEDIQGGVSSGRKGAARSTPRRAAAGGKPRRGIVVAVVVFLLIAAGAAVFIDWGGSDPTEEKTSKTGLPPPEVETPPGDQDTPPIPPAVPASLEIRSAPEGARVTFQGEDLGVTPLSASDVTPGEGELVVELKGYERHVENVKIDGGDAFSREITLHIILATVQITSEPAGASIFLDGEPKGEAPVNLTEFPPGDYEIRAEMEGYETKTVPAEIVGGDNPPVSISLEARPATLRVSTQPSGARIRIDGQYVGKSPLSKELSAGKHRLEARLPLHEAQKWEMELAPGKLATHEVELKRPDDVRRFIDGVSEAEGFLKDSLKLRAWDRMNQILKDVGFPKDLTTKERSQARRLLRRVGGDSAPLELKLRFGPEGGPTVEGSATPSPSPASAAELAGDSKTYTLTVSTVPKADLRFCIIQFSLGSEDAFRIHPYEGRRSAPDAKLPSLDKGWSETLRRQKGDVRLFLVLGTTSDLTLAALDDAKSQANALEDVDPVARGKKVVESIEKRFAETGQDFCIRMVWVDDR
ncbi:MAG: serine/threonine protein kinase [Planctomycetota bacterium]|nr:serine/threonine protein kinase [Planctomycetota bacterium]